MADHVVDALLAGAEAKGVTLDRRALMERYPAVADEYVDRYEADAAFNGLQHPRAEAMAQVRRYADLIDGPTQDTRLPPFGSTPIDPTVLPVANECEPLR